MTKEEMAEKLNSRNELSFAVEERYTNLRVFIGHNGNGPLPIDTVFMRLDKLQAYSAPLDEHSYEYLQNPPSEVTELLEYGFKTPIEKLDEILTILERMKPRACLPW